MRINFVPLVLCVLRERRVMSIFFIMLFGNKAFDIFLCLPDSSSELRSLIRNLVSEYTAH
jgi:hypothetical protein